VGKTQAMLKAENILEKHRIAENDWTVMDLRKSKGCNRYAEIVFNSFETIDEMLSRGYSIYRIFQILKNGGAFEANAYIANFYKALERERLRRGNKISSSTMNVCSDSDCKRSTTAGNKGVPLTPPKQSDEKTKEPEGDGNKRVVTLNGRDVEISVHLPDDLRDAKIKENYSFSDYPKYIQDSIRKSERRGTILEDKEKNSQMVQDWIEQQRSSATKDD
jgi:hypothetical protein